MVELPNANWIRSEQRPDWSVCLDPENRFYGWKMFECNGNWASSAKLTASEVEYALICGPLRPHWPKFEQLAAHLKGTPTVGGEP
jgi:hypothetical protein